MIQSPPATAVPDDQNTALFPDRLVGAEKITYLA
jgi:hypothetical protein